MSQDEHAMQVKQLTLEKEILSLNKEIADLQKGLLQTQTAQLPSGSLKTKSGSLHFDENYSFVALEQVYVAIDKILEDIVWNLNSSFEDKPSFVILDEVQYQNMIDYRITMQQINWLMEQANMLQIDNVTEEQPNHDFAESKSFDPLTTIGLGLGAAEGILATTSNIGSIFKSDRTIKAHAFDISEESLVAELFRKLRGQSFDSKILYPKIVGIQPATTNNSKLLETLSELLKVGQAIQQSNHPIAAILYSRINSFIADLDHSNDQRESKVKKLLNTEALITGLDTDSLFIKLTLSTAQGSILSKDNFWRNTTLFAVGAASLHYFVFNQASEILDSASLIHQTAFKKIPLV